jgi:hypothetical protein
MSLAVNVVDQALERDAKTLSETAESSLSSAKEQFRRDNGLLVLVPDDEP